MKLLTVLSALLILASAAGAQDSKANTRADAKAHARADSKDQSSKSSKQSHTRKVVVRDGKTIVDEETINGKAVRPGRRAGQRAGKPSPDLSKELERMLREMEKDMPAELRGLRKAGGANKNSSSSTHTRRMVVRNGKVIVNEETVDGRAVKPGQRAGKMPAELERMLRDLERDLPKGAGALPGRKGSDSKGGKSGAKSGGSSKGLRREKVRTDRTQRKPLRKSGSKTG